MNDVEQQGVFARIQSRISRGARARRAALLRSWVSVPLDAKILDLGGGTGAHLRAVFPEHRNITVCDISERDLSEARARYGFDTVLLQETERLPFADDAFDFCFCSSVIEHVTGPKEVVTQMTGDREFRAMARSHQLRFAAEVARVSKGYFVQTPYRYFPVESHTWLPGLIVLLPRRRQMALIALFNKFWIKRTAPDWYLFDRREMREAFPDATIRSEQFCGLIKSLMAVRDIPND